MRTTRPSTSFFALLCAVALVGGSVGEPFNVAGCAHHSAVLTGVALDSTPHGRHAGAQGVVVHGVGADEGDTEGGSHGPCLCIGVCAGSGVVGVAAVGASPAIARGPVAPAGSDRAAVDSNPTRRIPYLLPYPTAPPHVG